jgi:hypothetical protein
MESTRWKNEAKKEECKQNGEKRTGNNSTHPSELDEARRLSSLDSERVPVSADTFHL